MKEPNRKKTRSRQARPRRQLATILRPTLRPAAVSVLLTAVVALALTGASPAIAGPWTAMVAPIGAFQDEPPRERERRHRDIDGELADTMEQFMVLRLTKFLELDAEQADAALPLIKQLARDRREHGHQRRESIRTLLAMSQDDGTDDEMIRQRLDSFRREDDRFRSEQEQAMEQIRSLLDVRQEARLLAFEDRFRDEVRRRVEDARGGGPGMGRRRPPEREPRR